MNRIARSSLVVLLLWGCAAGGSRAGAVDSVGTASTTARQRNTGPHGGRMVDSDGARCELSCDPDGFRLYLYDEQGKPLSARGVRGVLLLSLPGARTVKRLNLYPESDRRSRRNQLFVALDLTKVARGNIEVECYLSGIRNQGAFPVHFARRFPLRLDPEKLAIFRQRICPVTGEKLGSMGRPPKTVIAGATVFVCCEPCIETLRDEPAKYLAKLPRKGKSNARAAIKVTRSTTSDRSAIRRQKTCPVMDQPLGSMGAPWKVRVGADTVFLCCKHCIEKIKKRPKVYLAKLAKK